MSRFLSPYDLNPLNINPLKDLVERFVDFDALRSGDGPELFISATNVQTGELRVFTRAEITPEVVMASAAQKASAPTVPVGFIPALWAKADAPITNTLGTSQLCR